MVGELVRKIESDYVRGTTKLGDYVDFSMYDTIEKINAYLNSKFTSGQTDSLGREKPFFNIVVAASNIWYRATDIDRSNIKIKPTKSKDSIDALMATAHLQDWMRRENFGAFLNEWGRVLARYGSAIIKVVENSSGLHLMVPPWNRIIVDPVDFDANPKIEILDLTEGQLRKNDSYDQKVVSELCASAKQNRQTMGRVTQDSKSDYIRVYEIHGELPLSYLTGNEKDETTYVQQMHVISFVGVGKGRKREYEDFTLYSGKEAKDPYMITHLIKEEGRTLSIGSVEHLFDVQWMMNHTMKNIKDTLDIASKIFFQTGDPRFLDKNVLTAVESGDFFHYDAKYGPATQMNTQHDIVSSQNFLNQWKTLGNEIVGVSESMLGAQPKSGTAWRQTEAILQENYSLFELMTENKGLYLEDLLRKFIIPHLKTKMNTKEEVMAVLSANDLQVIDSKYIKNKAIREHNKRAIEDILNGNETQTFDQVTAEQPIREELNQMGNKRSFKPVILKDGKEVEVDWAEQFKDLEWEVEIDITGEQRNIQEALTTLNTALKLILIPGFDQNKRAQMIVNRALEMTGVLSPLEIASLPAAPPTAGGSNVGME